MILASTRSWSEVEISCCTESRGAPLTLSALIWESAVDSSVSPCPPWESISTTSAESLTPWLCWSPCCEELPEADPPVSMTPPAPCTGALTRFITASVELLGASLPSTP